MRCYSPFARPWPLKSGVQVRKAVSSRQTCEANLTIGSGGIRPPSPRLGRDLIVFATPSRRSSRTIKRERRMAERVGFEPTCPFGQDAFEAPPLRPLRYLSPEAVTATDRTRYCINSRSPACLESRQTGVSGAAQSEKRCRRGPVAGLSLAIRQLKPGSE